jgi:hypothetical protein
MEAVLSNADVSVIWCAPLEVQAVDDARAWPATLASGTYGCVTLTDGVVSFAALLLPEAYRPVQQGERLRLTRHRVQWTNNERHWFVSALEAAGPVAPVPAGLRALPRVAPGTTVNVVTLPTPGAAPAAARPTKRAKKAAHPFIL